MMQKRMSLPVSMYCLSEKGLVVAAADAAKVNEGNSCCIITYGMGVYWAKAAAKQYPGQVEIIDLRTLFPLDEELVYSTVKKHGKCLVLTEEQQNNSFAEALAGRISAKLFSVARCTGGSTGRAQSACSSHEYGAGTGDASQPTKGCKHHKSAAELLKTDIEMNILPK